MKYKVIGLAGPAHCGKNTASTVMSAMMPAYQEMSFADPLKRMLMVGLKLDAEQVYGAQKEDVDGRYGCTARHMMQTLGTEWGRRCVGEDVWLRAMQNHLAPYTIITDVRFQNEADFVRERGILIHIVRERKIAGAHISEQGVLARAHDMSIDNCGTLDEFQETVADLVVRYLR